jgi:HAE1 family hydrophobic/amphiphilic exporter-1
MNPVHFSIREPVKVAVIVLLALIFGFVGLFRMPYQLSPDLTVPLITVTTIWTGATPYEVEREIIEQQENVLKGIPNLVEMESSATMGRGVVTLRFKLGTEINEALLRVSNKLSEVRSYPDTVERPFITATGEATSPVVWMVLIAEEGNPRSVYEYKSFFEDEVRQYLERIDGVADLFMGGGTFREMHVILDPQKLAVYGLTTADIARVLAADNVNVSAGSLGVGRRDFRVRTLAEFQSPEELKKVVIRSTGQKRIHLSDVADVEQGYEKRRAASYHLGRESINIGVRPEAGVNVLELTDNVEKVVNWLNQEKLKSQGVKLHWAYDQRPYIRGAIGLVQTNILIGGFLAVIVLLIFLRSFSSTLIIATSLPISIIGTFMFLYVFGRSLNVVSLAGISFSVGMLLDNAIVVLENIDRHRKMGKSAFDAAYEGTQEVWGAILASSLTTVSVFLPILFIGEEAGQLFRDITIAVTCAIILSLFVSISVIPTYANKLFSVVGKTETRGSRLVAVGDALAERIMAFVGLVIKSNASRIGTVALATTCSVLLVILLVPRMEYLPQGNRNFVFNFIVPPPGLSYEERSAIGKTIFRELEPYTGKEHEGLPGIRDGFFISSEQFMFFGAMSTSEERAGELIPLFSRVINGIPGLFGVSSQAGLFQTRLGGGRTIDVDVSGNDMNGVVRAAGAVFGMIRQDIQGAQIRPRPSIEVLYPEINILPERDRLRAAGMSAADLGISLDVLLDGRKISEFKQEGAKKIDLVLKGSNREFSTPEDLYEALVATPLGTVVPVSSLSTMQATSGMTEIRHLERQRTITLQVTPPKTIPLEEAMVAIESVIVPRAREQGLLNGIGVTLRGEADKLTQTRKALQWDLLLAILIVYLLLAALFSNFIYPVIVLFVLPVAAAGGVIGLRLVNLLILPQPLDILTMLGFVILIGVVVNNAILIIHQSLNNIRIGGMNHRDAVLTATKTRLRPIYMTTVTSIFGMFPLVVWPGPGSEIYRGLGSVLLGGLAFSSLLVIFIVPALLMYFIRMETIDTAHR